MRIKLLLIVAPFAMVATVALAKDNEDNAAPPTVFQAVLDCKSVPDPTERLACLTRQWRAWRLPVVRMSWSLPTGRR
jgi:hypothetical protein